MGICNYVQLSNIYTCTNKVSKFFKLKEMDCQVENWLILFEK